MSSLLFDQVCAQLAIQSDLSTLEARGTIRIALKEAGLTAAHLTSHQMKVVIEQVLPEELAARGVDDIGRICSALELVAKRLERDPRTDAGDRIDGLFRRTL